MSTPEFSGSFSTTNLAEVLRMLVQAKQTGILVLQNAEEEGAVSMENGMILNAKAGADSGMRALFQIVGWHDARFEFRQQTLDPALKRDLSVYDPKVLITGVAEKMGSAPIAATGG
jgi:hypothetical protein